jgi:NTE family protein
MTTRALVLGGGGPVGIAWESGLIAGFARAGVDLARADFILGTSAGSVVGARLASGLPAEDLAEHLLRQPEQDAAPFGPPSAELARVMELIVEGQSGTRNPAETRRELGALALAARTEDEETFRQRIAGALGVADPVAWPSREYACTAVDVEDGAFHLWRANSGVELAGAVASSCSVPGIFPPVTLKGRRYMDGGMRSATNADLAGGYDIVVVVAVQPPGLPSWTGRPLAEEVESLKEGGSTVVTILPDEAAGQAMGADLMDWGRSAPVARAALAQAAGQAEVLASVWG